MFVAHDDDMGLLSRAKEMARRIVPKPRNGNAAPNTVASNEGSTPPAPVEAPSLNASLEKVNGQASAMASMAQKRARALQVFGKHTLSVCSSFSGDSLHSKLM